MNSVNKQLIDGLVDDLQPVRALRFGHGLALVGIALAVTVVGVIFFFGLYRAALSGHASPYFYLANGLLAMLGAASATSVITMASPRVGNRHGGPRWAMAMVGVLPVVAMITLLSSATGIAALSVHDGACTLRGLMASLLTGGVLFIWLRHGAPVSPKIAGLHLGVAAGSLGSVAYGLYCPIDSIEHLGLSHIAPVVMAGLVGRFALPPFLRW